MKLSIIILTQNEEKMIKACLESVRQLADEIIVIDDQSTDKTIEIAKKYTEKIYVHKMKDFSSQREFALRQAQGEWVLYVDADERVTPALRDEILAIVKKRGRKNTAIAAYYIPRKNIFLGREQKPDRVERLFKREKLLGWFGKIHESPRVEGKKATLKNHLIHLTHRDISSMIKKTLEWSHVEAELRLQANHPPVTWYRLLKVMLREFYQQICKNRVYRYGTEGWIEGTFQVFSLFITYVRLWEKQRGESLETTYEKIDKKFLENVN